MPRQQREPIDRQHIDRTRSYTVADVAHCVGWTPKWLRKLIHEGRVHAFRPNGHEWRVPGDEVQRILATLEHQGGLPPRKSALDEANIQDIPVSEAQMDRVDPGWRSRPAKTPAASGAGEGRRKGFWDSMDDEVRRGNPLLFGEGNN